LPVAVQEINDGNNNDLYLFSEIRNLCLAPTEDFQNGYPGLLELRSLVVATSVDRKLFFNYFIDLWNYLSCLPTDDKYYLPPPYFGSQSELIKFIIGRIYSLEHGSFALGNNPILYGAKGVGKTTILKVVGLCTSILTVNVLPIYYDFEMRAILPINDILTLYLRKYNHHWKKRSSVLLLFDEFTYLYRDVAHVNVVKALHAFAKTYENSFTLLAASKSNIDSYYKPSPSEFSVAFPDLNDSIFVKRPVYRIRTGNVVEFMRKRYPQLDLEEVKTIFVDLTTDKGLIGSETEVENLVTHWSGGVGRVIHAIMKFREYVFADLSAEIVCDPILFNICAQLLPKTPIDKLSVPFPVVRVPLQTIYENLSRFAGRERILSKIYEWSDKSILFMDEVNNVQFLFPEQGRRLYAHIHQVECILKAFVLSLTLHDFDGGTPGHSNEFIVDFLSRYYDDLPLCREVLVIKNNSIYFEDEKDKEKTRPIEDVDVILGKILKWRVDGHEQGVDRIILTQSESNREIFIQGIQMKSGQLKLKITEGNLETQRTQGRTGKKINDGTINGMLVKGELGFQHLLAGLTKTFPTCSFRASSLDLYTTKEAGPTLTVFDGIHDSQIDSVGSFSWKLTHSSAWLKDILPDSILSSLCLP
jgi:hypothetical protein